MQKTGFRRLMSFLLVLVLVFGQFGLVKPEADVTDVPALIITGTGVKTELAFTLEELKGMQDGKLMQYYSSINRVGTKISSSMVLKCGLVVNIIVGSTKYPTVSSRPPPNSISASLEFLAYSI